MRTRITKLTLSLLLILTLVAGLFGMPGINASAANSKPSGDLEEMVMIDSEISEDEYNEVASFDDQSSLEYFTGSKKNTSSYWSSFSKPFYDYNVKMTDAQKKLYDDLYASLYEMIEGGADCGTTDYNGTKIYISPKVKYKDLTKTEVKDIIHLMMYDCPEFYYVNSFSYRSTVSGKNEGTVQLGVYDDFATGAARKNAAANIKKKIDWYLNQVNPEDSAYDREKKIHDLIAVNCTYDTKHKYPYTQSCASAFLNPKGYTVCAGYSEAFALLCCASGIPAYSITSASHEWNQAKIDGYWYAVDLTWDDTDSGGKKEITYDQFNVSDETMLKAGEESHTLEDFWERVGRNHCWYDYGDAPEIVHPTECRGVDYSAVYDYDYYVEKYDDVKNDYGNDDEGALEHFVNVGIPEGRQGKEDFNVQSYRNQYADLRNAFGWNDLRSYYMHYINNGQLEGRKGEGCDTVMNPAHTFFVVDFSPVYDYNYYSSHYADLVSAFNGDDVALFSHFLNHGLFEGRQASESFDLWTYIGNYEDLRNAFGWDLLAYVIHYINNGRFEGRVAV